jgi:hypothetical protein
MDELIKEYLKNHLSISLDTEYDYLGKHIIVQLKLDDEVISSDFYILENENN